MAAQFFPRSSNLVLTHAERVRRLYKKAIREVESHILNQRWGFRYQAVQMRARFDANKDIKDPRKAKQVVLDGERELFERHHPQPLRFAYSPGGLAYGREPHVSDAYLDHWHPLEKAQYPDYFARRDIRKREFIERWEKEYGSPSESDLH